MAGHSFLTRGNCNKAAVVLGSLLVTSVVWGHGIEASNDNRQQPEWPTPWYDYLLPTAAARAQMRIDEAAGFRYIESDGLPDHEPGRFPNSGNPHSISSQSYRFRVPLAPRFTGRQTPLQHADFGVALNGVPFDPQTAEYWQRDRSSGWNLEAIGGSRNLGLDRHQAHVQPNGAYHYHGLPTGLVEQTSYRQQPVLLGYAADGFPIYTPYGYQDADDANSPVVALKPGYQLKSGTRPDGPGGRYDGAYTRDFEYVAGQGDLDQCNGRQGVTPEYPQGTYYYVISESFPYIPRCWQGEADDSFRKMPGNAGGGRDSAGGGHRSGAGMRSGGDRGPGGGQPGGGRGLGGGPPPEARDACSGQSAGAACSFNAPHGTVRGQCHDVREGLMCVPERR